MRSKDSGSRIAGSGGGKIIFLFFWPLNSMIFLIFYDLKKKAKDLFLIWLIKCPYFFVVIADDKFEMIVGRTFLIFFLVHFFTSFFIRKFSIGFICKKNWIYLLHCLLIVRNKNRYTNLRSWENFIINSKVLRNKIISKPLWSLHCNLIFCW